MTQKLTADERLELDSLIAKMIGGVFTDTQDDGELAYTVAEVRLLLKVLKANVDYCYTEPNGNPAYRSVPLDVVQANG